MIAQATLPTLRIAAAQLGPTARHETRRAVVSRLLRLLEDAAARGAQLVVFPELALTTFFPRWHIEDDAELASYYESELPGPETRPLFEAAARLRIGFHLGYAERTWQEGREHRYNTAVLVGRDGAIVGKYRKIHLPGDREPQPGAAFQHLEKRYFETGDLGFRAWRAFGGVVGMFICNDRRWPEAWRVLGLQGVELVLVGYNTPMHNPEAPNHDRLAGLHHRLVLQAGCYQNGTWAVAAAKAGTEEGVAQLGDSMIVAPSGEVVAQSQTLGDELVIADCDLGLTRSYKQTIFNFEAHREPQAYGLIVQRKGAQPPP